MKSEFQEFYHPNEKDLLALKNEAIFIFDACALLSLYKFSTKERGEFLKIISKLCKQNRVWQPHQFSYEYQQNRQEVIKKEVDSYTLIKKDIEKYFKDIEKISVQKSFPKHQCVKIESIIKKIKKGQKEILKENIQKIEELKSKHPNWSKKDPIRDKLTTLFVGKIGREYTEEELDVKYIDGDLRYKKFKPPGYMDTDKDHDDVTKKKKFGDLIAWFQILDKAKELEKPMVLITDDLKEDWWWIDKKKNRHGPRKELVKEMLNKTGVVFHMMDTGDLLEFGSKNLQINISQKTIDNIRELKDLIRAEKENDFNIEDSLPLTSDMIETANEEEIVDASTSNLTPIDKDLDLENKSSRLPENKVQS